MNKEWIKLTPRFIGENWDGYNQVDGTHYYDNEGQVYEFVPKSEYNQLRRTLDKALVFCKELDEFNDSEYGVNPNSKIKKFLKKVSK